MYSTIKPYRIETSVLLTVSVRSTFITTYVQGHLPEGQMVMLVIIRCG